jgi:hypothetical protein
LFGLASGSLTLVLNDESPTASPYSQTVPGGYNYVAIHNDTGELVFQYTTSQTTFDLSGYGSAFSNARFFSSGGGSPTPEPSTWAMMILGFIGLGYAGYRKTKARAILPVG